MDKKALFPLKKYTWKVVLAPFLKLFEVATELLMPFLTRYIIDEGIAKKDTTFTFQMGGLLLGMAVAGFAITMLAQYLAARVSSDYGYDLRKDLFHQVSSLSEKQLNDFSKQKALTLINNDSFSLQNGVMMFMRLVLRPPFLLVGSTILSFLIDWRAGLVFLVAILLSALVIGLVMVVSPKKYAAIQSNLDEISTLSNDSLKGARPIRAFNKEDYEEKKFAKSVNSYEKKNMSMVLYNALINPLTFFFIDGAILVIVYLAGTSSGVAGISEGEMVSLIQYLVSSLAALIMWSRMIVSLNKARASKKRIDAFLALAPSIQNHPSFVGDFEAKEPLIRFSDVSLSYGQKGDKPAVEHLSFVIQKGSWVGLIGGTGSGKSTTLSLLERLYEPTSGTISFRGEDLSHYDLAKLHEEISFVSQKPALFKGTIESNLRLAKPNASKDELIAVLKESLAYEYVSRFPEGLDHPVEEGGANLSGGQKQRLLIARALLKGGDILILDDSTSALDYLSDLQVRQHIASHPNLTKILVSQRASSLKDCDLILVYDNGHIIDQGTSEELLSRCSVYQDIVAMQKAQA